MPLDSSEYKMVQISKRAKDMLERLKIHDREPFYEVVDRILFETDSPIKK